MNKPYKKRISAGTFNYAREKCSGYFDVGIIENEKHQLCLSICGTINLKKGTCLVTGQCIDTIAKSNPTEKNKRIEEIWKRWHLNDMHAGCIHQREFEKEPYENHAKAHCDICDYTYGSAWLYEPLPIEIIAEIKTW